MDPDTQTQLKRRLEELPEVVRNAITSADIQKELRAVADKHKLHLDQWGKLENEVMLTLLGFASAPDFRKNILSEVGVSPEEATSLANDINAIVFEPIRQELERQLAHPSAQAKEVSAMDTAGQQAIASENASKPTAPGVLPATPPAPPPTEKAVRAPISSSYTSRQPSTERKIIDGDPYREMPQ